MADSEIAVVRLKTDSTPDSRALIGPTRSTCPAFVLATPPDRRGPTGRYSSFTGIEITSPAKRGFLSSVAPNLVWHPTHPAPSGMGLARR